MLRKINFAAFFTEPKAPSEAHSFEQYYMDLEAAISAVRREFPDSENAASENYDEGFAQAAKAFAEVIKIGKTLEKLPVSSLTEAEEARVKAADGVGEGGLVNVTGDASRLLAEKYIALRKGFLPEPGRGFDSIKVWPSAKCPQTLGQSYRNTYAKIYPEEAVIFRQQIATLTSRIEAYKEAKVLFGLSSLFTI